MKKAACTVALVAMISLPAFADQRLDEALRKSEEQFQKGKPEEAVKTLQKLVSQDPTTEPYLALARMQQRVGSIDEASETLTKAVAASSTPALQATTNAALAALDIRRGLGGDALNHANAAVKAQANGASLGALARAQAHAGDGLTALKTGDRAVQAEPNSAAAHLGRGDALLALRRNAEAAEEFRTALKFDPKMNIAQVRLALALTGTQPNQAVIEARKATDADQKCGEAFGALGLAILTADPKNWDEAISQAQQGATVLDPKDPEVQVEVGKILEAHGNYDQALASYQRALQQDPKYTAAREALVRAAYMLGKTDMALADAQKLLAENPNGSGEALVLIGRLNLQKKNWNDAQAYLERAVALVPTAEVHALLGTADQYTYRSPEALDQYKEAIRLEPQNLDYQTTYGLLLGVNKQYQAGIDVLKKVTANASFKGLPAAYLNLGWVLRNAEPKRTEEAIAAYKKALELDPKSAQAALGLGWAHTYARMWDEALASFQKAMQLDPTTTGEADDGIGWCYFFKKDMSQARASLERAASEGRNDPPLRNSIERIEKLIAAKQHEQIAKAIEGTEGPKDQGPNLEDLVRKLRTGAPAVKKQAALELGKVRDGVPFLCYSLLTDPDVDVRDVDVTALSNEGHAMGKEGIACLQKAMNLQELVRINDTKEDMNRQMKEGDLKRKIKELLQRLGH